MFFMLTSCRRLQRIGVCLDSIIGYETNGNTGKKRRLLVTEGNAHGLSSIEPEKGKELRHVPSIELSGTQTPLAAQKVTPDDQYPKDKVDFLKASHSKISAGSSSFSREF